jgi:broad specificity phosphatase PhoE/GNAT superfamily N-acetyltransferase
VPVSIVYETHGTTVDNENGTATGWLPGRLSEVGRVNAAALGRRRRDDGVDLVISSDLDRALETCRIAFDGSGIEVRTDARLRECDYGDLNGAPTEVVHAERLARVDRPFPGGQSYREVTAGLRQLLDELLRDHEGSRIVLVGHAATRFGLDHLFTGRPLERAVTAPFAWREGWEYVLDGVWPQLSLADGAAALAMRDELVEVYRAAFTAPPYDETEESVQRFAAETLPKHAERDGFRLVTLRLAGDLVGWGYGYTGEHGQWWTDRVASSAPADVAGDWLGGHFEVVELAVIPQAQHRGFGAALTDALVHAVPHDRALLTTYAGDRPAPRLYARLGWQRLASGVLDGSDLWGLDLGSGRLRGWRPEIYSSSPTDRSSS